MITLTRLDGKPIVISAHQIETVEAIPDSVITLLSGRKYLVRESNAEIIRAAVAYRRRLGFPAAVEDDPAGGRNEVS